MSVCKHESCGRECRVWLPVENVVSDVIPHPWCRHCGVIKNISDDCPKELGYWINILSRISTQYSLKKVQTRLVSKYLENKSCFHDLYGITGSAQTDEFLRAVSSICKIPKNSIYTQIY